MSDVGRIELESETAEFVRGQIIGAITESKSHADLLRRLIRIAWPMHGHGGLLLHPHESSDETLGEAEADVRARHAMLAAIDACDEDD